MKTNNSPFNLNKIELLTPAIAVQRAKKFTEEFNTKFGLASDSSLNSSTVQTASNTDAIYLRMQRTGETEITNFELGIGDGSKYRLTALKAYVKKN